MASRDGHRRKRWAVWVPSQNDWLTRHGHLTNRPHFFKKPQAKEVCNKYARSLGHSVHCVLVPFDLTPPKE